jgi:hypothetical protein
MVYLQSRLRHAGEAGERAAHLLAVFGGFHLDAFLTVPAKPESTRNCFGHEAGGLRHIPSERTKAQTLGMEWLAQMSGLVWRQPSVCSSESFGLRGA